MAIFTIAFVAVLVWTVLMIPYMLWLKHTTFYVAQRSYLLASILSGLILGIIKAFGLSETQPIKSIGYVGKYQEIIIGNANKAFDSDGAVSNLISSPVFMTFYFVISITLIVFLIFKVMELLAIVRGNNSTSIHGMTVVESPNLHTPFSFFHLIFLSKDRQLDTQDLHTIIRHEAVHTKQMHSIDIVLTEVLLTFTWFLPVILFYKKELIILHEFIADSEVIKEVPTQEYGMLLLAQRMGVGKSLTHNFAKSELKSRFLRMAQPPTSKWQLAGFISIFPLLFLCNNLIGNLNFKNLGRDPIIINTPKEELTSREIYVTPDGQLRVVEKETNINDYYTPQYPGGHDALREFLVNNLKVDNEIKKGSEKIIARINFDEDGKVELVTYLRAIHPEMAKALDKVFYNMPAWKVPVINGKKVRSEVHLPVVFGE